MRHIHAFNFGTVTASVLGTQASLSIDSNHADLKTLANQSKCMSIPQEEVAK